MKGRNLEKSFMVKGVMMKIIGMIPARGGSQGLPGKNIIDLGGKPLIAHTIEECKKSGLTDFYCSTDSDDIISICDEWGCKVIKRPAQIASSTSSMKEVLEHFADELENKNIEFDGVMVLYPVYPFRDSKMIDEAIRTFEEEDGKRSILGMHEPRTHPYLVRTVNSDGTFEQILQFDINKNYRRQTYPQMFEICHMICIVPKDLVKKVNNQLYTDGSKAFIIKDIIRTTNIDTKRDLIEARFLIENNFI